MKRLLIPVVLVLILAGYGLSTRLNATAIVPVQAEQPPTFIDPSRVDEQGAVSITVKPSNLDKPDQTLDFEISMDTHSVDLSMDLTALATLTTDTGVTTNAVTWDAPRGGHHVSGKLSFPNKINGVALLKDASTLTLILRNIDIPERRFKWEISK